MKRPGTTPPFVGPDGEVLPDSIADVGYLRLGGVDQWVLIRGANVANPVLVVLHGGPGFSDTAFFRRFNAKLEESFTVVHWEQRGTGMSFDPAIPRQSMTVEQLVADLDELVSSVRLRLGKRKVAILGHSWGSALGVLYAARFPDKVVAYVGAAQIGDWARGEAIGYAQALADAERMGKRKLLERLRALGPPPHTAKSLLVERTCVQSLHGELRPRALWKMGSMLLHVPEASLLALPEVMRGFRFTLECMWPEVSRLNLIEAVPELKMPVFIFVGRRDHWVPPETSVAYFEALRAPSKQLLWFEASAHEAFVDEPAKFNAAMIELVRPLCEPPAAAPRAPQAFPGDDLLPEAKATVAHHVDIDAPPEQVWPWLVQMGRRRGGWYSWDVLDNGGVPSADRIVPEFQALEVGDILPVQAKGDAGFAVLAIDPPHALVLGDPSLLPGHARPDPHAPRATWAFSLEPLGAGRTRLVARVRADYESSVKTSLLRPIVGVVHDFMERKQLATLKQRAEAH
jgi:pimeloyl-ACP methyl ester carboxylesterase/uncharacterized protein YndB with AHSA1/START domain